MKGARMNYSKKKLLKALKSIKDGKYKICEASRIYEIPRQTLADKIKGRRPSGYCKPGPQAVLGTEAETKIEKWLLENARLGFPLSKEGVHYSVKYIVDRIPEAIRSSIPFRNNTPGKGWFKSFKKRHPRIAIEYCDFTTKSKSTDVDMKNWYRNVKQILDEKNCSYLLQEPDRIYVMNEFMVNLNPDNSFSLVEKKKSPKLASRYYDNNTFAILLVSNASGELAPPMITTRSTETFDYFSSLNSSNWGAVVSDAYMMTSEIYYDYVTDMFNPYLRATNVKLPIIVFVEGDFSCTSLPLTEFCNENNIIFLRMLKNSTKCMNPLDAVSGFPVHLLKTEFESKLRYDHSENHPVISLINDILTNAAIEPYIVEQFQTCGIYPFSHDSGSDESSKDGSEDIAERKSTIVDYFESKIPADILQQFHQCKSADLSWSGAAEYTALFNFWTNAVKDLRDSDLQSIFQENLDAFIVEEEIENDTVLFSVNDGKQ